MRGGLLLHSAVKCPNQSPHLPQSDLLPPLPPVISLRLRTDQCFPPHHRDVCWFLMSKTSSNLLSQARRPPPSSLSLSPGVLTQPLCQAGRTLLLAAHARSRCSFPVHSAHLQAEGVGPMDSSPAPWGPSPGCEQALDKGLPPWKIAGEGKVTPGKDFSPRQETDTQQPCQLLPF